MNALNVKSVDKGNRLGSSKQKIQQVQDFILNIHTYVCTSSLYKLKMKMKSIRKMGSEETLTTHFN